MAHMATLIAVVVLVVAVPAAFRIASTLAEQPKTEKALKRLHIL